MCNSMDNNLQKELFVATLVHDLKNPLAAQISAIEQLARGVFGEVNDSQKEILKLTMDSCKYMQKLLYTVLETYKNENGQIKLNKNYFNPENFLKMSIKEYSAMFIEKRLTPLFSCHIEEKDNILYADELQIKRVVENILNNQVCYAFKNTEIKISLYKKEENLIFEFENSSPKIDETTKAQIFEKYKIGQVSNQKLSTGLGLYLAKQIISAHEGKIYLCAKDTSNKFIFEIPQSNTQKTQVVW